MQLLFEISAVVAFFFSLCTELTGMEKGSFYARV